jgi:carbon monoxide dehydrogenase subunit G
LPIESRNILSALAVAHGSGAFAVAPANALQALLGAITSQHRRMKQSFVRRSQIDGLDLAAAWDLIHDVRAIEACSSHIDEATAIAEREWSARLRSSVGPFTVSAPIQVRIMEEEPPSMVKVRIRGEDRVVGTRLAVDLVGRLLPDKETAAAVLEGSYEVTGQVANLGSALVKRQAEAMIQEFWVNFCAALSRHADARTTENSE